MRFAHDLRENISNGDAHYLQLLDDADAYIENNGLDLPEEPEARTLRPDPESLTHPLRELELAGAGVTSIVWATGFVQDYSWLQVDAFDENGRPQHQRGAASEPGVYFLSLPAPSGRVSSFYCGSCHDAKYVADQISIQQSYLAYNERAAPVPSDAV
jgi:putative flavoprotein involved in K+ transport